MRPPNNKPTSAPDVTDSPATLAGGSHQRMVRLQGYRVKLKNRRVYASAGPDGDVWLKWVKLEGKDRKVMGVRLTPEAAAATVSAIIDALKDIMRTGTVKQPNDPSSATHAGTNLTPKEKL